MPPSERNQKMTETPAERAEARAIRRRWLTIGELVAVAGVMIAALTLWTNWSDQRSEKLEKAEADAKAAATQGRLELRATVVDDGRQVALEDPAHEILETQMTFPTPLKISPRSPVLPRIESGWFTEQIRDATDGGPDVGEGRLPALVTVTYRAGDSTRRDRAIVELVWRTSGRLLAGRALRIEAARIRERGGDQARIDALWSQELTRLKAG